MNILELTGMKSTKYGGVESYFAELVKICRVDKFIFVYESMPISEKYVNDINKWGGGEIICKKSKQEKHNRFLKILVFFMYI